MTAEIAIINRSAVTLATDSAVTLTVRGEEKIYNAADKLFELSGVDPIGIMIYNNLDFMGIALDVAIKEFRRKSAAVSYTSVFDAAQAFFHYLINDANTAPDIEMQREHVGNLLHSRVEQIKATFDQAATRELQRNGKRADLAALLTMTLETAVSDLEAGKPSDCFEGISDSDLLITYSDVADETIELHFGVSGRTDRRCRLVQN